MNPTYPAHLTPAPAQPDLDARLSRIETRLVRLMLHLGLQADGSPSGSLLNDGRPLRLGGQK